MMKDLPLVSVIMPAYNAEKYIEKKCEELYPISKDYALFVLCKIFYLHMV